MSPSWSQLTPKNSSPVEFSHHLFQMWPPFTSASKAVLEVDVKVFHCMGSTVRPGARWMCEEFWMPVLITGVRSLAVLDQIWPINVFTKGPHNFWKMDVAIPDVWFMKVVNVCCKTCGRKIIPLPNCSPRSMLIIRLEHFWAWRCSLALHVEKLVVWEMFVS